MRTTRPHPLPVALAVLALASGLVACSDDGGDPEGDAGPTTTSEVAGLPGADGIAPDEDGTDPLPPLADDVALPVVFVHGFAGSAQQYESQAMRYAANGWPQERILAYDHDGAGADIPAYADGVDEVVDDALAEFDAPQVYLVGHSRGTGVGTAYLADPERAAKVAKYIAIDGAPCPVGEVPCAEVTQQTLPGQSHVEAATSAESFAQQYEFLVGEAPEVTEVVPQREPVVLEGRAVQFPANTGREGATLDVWAVDPATGYRVADEPHVSFEIGPDGSFGPFVAESGAHYEWLLSAPGSEVQHHLYLQPYVRSSGLVRLLSSEPDGATRTNTNTGDDHSSLIAIRMREWYAADDADLPGPDRDVLEVAFEGPDGGDRVDVITDFVGNGAIGLHLHDDAATPGETTLGPLPYFSGQPFQNGVDVFVPAADPPDGTITVTNLPRGDESRPQALATPNWPSSGHAISLVFTDYPVD